MTYRHTPDMGEISGFGGGYEACCQDMLEAGMNWLVAKQAEREVDLKASTIPNVYGLLRADSSDAKELEKAVLAAANGEATGAMHHTVMARLIWIAANGWDKYCAELRNHAAKEETNNG